MTAKIKERRNIYYIDIKDRKKLLPMFEGINEKIIDTCIQGRNDSAAFADDPDFPKCAKLTVGGRTTGSGGFSIIAGDSKCDSAEELVLHRREGYLGSEILLASDSEWEKVIERVYGMNAVKITRYALSKTEHNFDVEKLSEWSRNVPEGYTLKMMDGDDYDRCAASDWAYDNIANFASREQFCLEATGVCCLYGDELVCAATPYCLWDKGIEIEIDTHPDHRRKGLARACAARLIIECLKRDLYPSWDAANEMSLALAVSLGYVADQPYTAYYIAQPGKRPYVNETIRVRFGDEILTAKITRSDSRGLCVLFPGMGYSCDRPLLHFTGRIALNKGYDVLALSYGNIPTTLKEARCERVTREVTEKCRALIAAVDLKKYETVVFAAKSLGTLCAGVLGKEIKQIWYTPVEESFENFSEENCLVFTGDADSLLGIDKLRELGLLGSDKVKIIERTGHSLDVFDAMESIDILRSVMKDTKEFFEKNDERRNRYDRT